MKKRREQIPLTNNEHRPPLRTSYHEFEAPTIARRWAEQARLNRSKKR